MPVDGDDRLGRARSFLIGGWSARPPRSQPPAAAVSSRGAAGSACCTPRGSRPSKVAPCYRELIEEQDRADD